MLGAPDNFEHCNYFIYYMKVNLYDLEGNPRIYNCGTGSHPIGEKEIYFLDHS
jgi:hypothetical protein